LIITAAITAYPRAAVATATNALATVRRQICQFLRKSKQNSIISNGNVVRTSNQLLGRPERQFRTGFCFTRDVFFRQPHLRGPSADRRETLPHDRNLAQKKQKKFKNLGVLS